MKIKCIFLLSLTLEIFYTVVAKRPNIVLILTDDQDVLLGSVTPMKKVQRLIANDGATFSNAFASTPICCPSRSSILTGLYQHNHGTLNNSVSGGCNSISWQQNLEPYTFGPILHDAGYETFYAGKYLNTYGFENVGGTEHVPPGWDWWMGLKGNSRYYNYTLSINGSAQFFGDQYLTNVIQNYSVNFLESMRYSSKSFLMVLATPACHGPFTPEPKYDGIYKGIKVPRTPNFNTHRLKDRHWLINLGAQPLPGDTIARIDNFQAMRWETLRSVDDMAAATIRKLQDIGQLSNTYIIFTSDHGYHLGQFSLPYDKRQPYETDIRVPMFVRGPGIPPKSLVSAPVVNIDIAPTIVDMARLPTRTNMDGFSFLQFATKSPRRPPRQLFLIEYVGEGDSSSVSPDCPLVNDDNLSLCQPESSCKCQDSRNNTYICLREINSYDNSLYCEFYKEIGGHREYFDINQDPYQLDNIYSILPSTQKRQLKATLSTLIKCRGLSCHNYFS